MAESIQRLSFNVDTNKLVRKLSNGSYSSSVLSDNGTDLSTTSDLKFTTNSNKIYFLDTDSYVGMSGGAMKLIGLYGTDIQGQGCSISIYETGINITAFTGAVVPITIDSTGLLTLQAGSPIYKSEITLDHNTGNIVLNSGSWNSASEIRLFCRASLKFSSNVGKYNFYSVLSDLGSAVSGDLIKSASATPPSGAYYLYIMN